MLERIYILAKRPGKLEEITNLQAGPDLTREQVKSRQESLRFIQAEHEEVNKRARTCTKRMK